MDYKKMVAIVIETRKLLEEYEIKNTGKSWSKEEILIGLMTDLGDLSRIILAKEGRRKFEGDIDLALRHELADCMWVIIVLSDKYKIDLSQALLEMSKDLKRKLKKA